MEKFPDHIDAPQMANGSTTRSPSPLKPSSGYGLPNGSNMTYIDRRPTPLFKVQNGTVVNGQQPGLAPWSASHSSARGHGRQKSLSDALRTIRTRKGSVSQNAHEIADALRAPVSPKLVVSDKTLNTILVPRGSPLVHCCGRDSLLRIPAYSSTR